MSSPCHKPKQVEYIQQRKHNDCGVACVAMLVDATYSVVYSVLKKLNMSTRGGLYFEDIYRMLEEFGRTANNIKSLPKAGRALLAIQWNDNGAHFVVWDSKRKQILDPEEGVYSYKELLKYATIDEMWRISKPRQKQ